MKTRQIMKSMLLLVIFATSAHGQFGGKIITTPKPKIPTTPQPIVTQPDWKIELPSIDPITTQYTYESGSFVYRIVVKQGSGSIPTVSAKNMPEGATFDSATNTFSWSPNHLQSGLHVVEFTASNNIGSFTEEMPIQVQNVASPYFIVNDIETLVRWDENRGNFIHLIRPEIWNAGDRSLLDVSVRIEAVDDEQVISLEEEAAFLVREIAPDQREEVSSGTFFIEFVPSKVRKSASYQVIVEGVNTGNEPYSQSIIVEIGIGPRTMNPFYENSDALILEDTENYEITYSTKAGRRAHDIHMYTLDLLGPQTQLRGHGLGKDLDMKYPVFENEETGTITLYWWDDEITTFENLGFSHSVLGTGRFEGVLENMGGYRGSILLHDEQNDLIKICPMNTEEIQEGWIDHWAANPNYKYLGLVDLDGDGYSDILWYDFVRRDLVTWKKGWAANNEQILRESIDIKDVQIVAVGDTNRDQADDIVFYDKQTGLISIGLLNQHGNWFHQAVELVDSRIWKYETYGDFDGDGQVDVLFRNKNDHQHFMVVMLKPGPLAPQHEFHVTIDPEYHVVTTIDWNGNGKSDILLEQISGQVVEKPLDRNIKILEMNGAEVTNEVEFELPGRFRVTNIKADFSW